ncbi:GntR family transcriptional regulator [Paenibacillus lycopersici]|uniref:GntR family transcriptional regulator n=1 Tax=Paenibacillus lycopersici TaxID=2704462 RepID=A0A6C0G5U9_9BACL|nr:GntR family transcriptional regulator [Paenibacillus lycopersici]QHT62580.1 GntR family transcriptional regulator [Paenibacillus lycopersici]
MKQKALPKYAQLKKEITAWLDTGRLQPNEQMPSENEIAERFGISRQTVRQTLGELEQEGRLYRIQGKGTFAAEPKASEQRPEAQTIGLVTTYISDYIFPFIVRGAESAIRAKGYNLMLSSTDNDKRRERESLSLLTSRPLGGLIIEPTKSAEGNPNLDYFLALHNRRIPYVMINAEYPEISSPSLTIDDEAGGCAAAEHLIGLGHRRIAGFFKTDDRQGVLRLKGFMQAHQREGHALHPDFVIAYRTEEQAEKPVEAAARLLSRPEGERPTALVCYNDQLALRLLEVIRQLDLSVPGDVSIVGFDDSSLATATEVKLTTLTHPKEQMGEDAARMLFELIESGGASVPASRSYKPELIIRESTRQISEQVSKMI